MQTRRRTIARMFPRRLRKRSDGRGGSGRRRYTPLPMKMYLLAFVLGVALVVFACSGDGSNDGSDVSDSSSAAAEENSSNFDPATARALLIQARDLAEPSEVEEAYREATSLAPTLVDAWLLLAGHQAGQGDVDGAFESLAQLTGLGLRPPVDRYPPLEPLQDDPRWADLLTKLDRNVEPAGSSDVLFSLPEKDLLTEGGAYDPKDDAWYVSAVHGRKIVRIGAKGVSDWLADRDEVGGVFGLAVDSERRLLWATTAWMPQVRGFDPEDDSRSGTALLAVDLDSAEIVGRYELTAAESALPDSSAAEAVVPQLNDLAVAADGTVYATDLKPPGGVYRLAPGAETLQRIGEDLLLNSPQGVVLLDDDSILVVADYSLGLVALDLGSGESWFVEPPGDLWFQTFDGLASAGDGELIAIQNGGYPPHRILHLQLSPDRRSVARWSVAARALPEWNEPTLGTVVRDGTVGKKFVYVAASQWPLFPAGGEPDPEQLVEPLIMSLDLSASM